MDLKTYLNREGITACEFSKRLGVPRNTIYNYLNGMRRPSAEMSLKIEKLTKKKVSIEDLMSYADKNMKKKQKSK